VYFPLWSHASLSIDCKAKEGSNPPPKHSLIAASILRRLRTTPGVQESCHPGNPGSLRTKVLRMSNWFSPLLFLLANSSDEDVRRQIEFLKAENEMPRARVPKTRLSKIVMSLPSTYLADLELVNLAFGPRNRCDRGCHHSTVCSSTPRSGRVQSSPWSESARCTSW